MTAEKTGAAIKTPVRGDEHGFLVDADDNEVADFGFGTRDGREELAHAALCINAHAGLVAALQGAAVALGMLTIPSDVSQEVRAGIERRHKTALDVIRKYGG